MWSALRCASHRPLGSRRAAPAPAAARPFTLRSSCSTLQLRKGHARLLAGAPRAHYTEWPRAELAEELRRRYLPITGSKDVLVSRLLEDDSLCSQSPPGKSKDTQQRMALSIREDGVVPPFSKVTKAQIITELRRRGAMVSAKTKIELYEALEKAVRLAKAGDSSLPETVSPFETDAEVAGNATASAQNETFAKAINIVSDPTYNPASATVAELRGLLQAIKVPCQGRKAELLARVNAYRAAMDSKGTGGGVSVQSGAAESAQDAVLPSSPVTDKEMVPEEGTRTAGAEAQIGAGSGVVMDAIRSEVWHLDPHLGLPYSIFSCSSTNNSVSLNRAFWYALVRPCIYFRMLCTAIPYHGIGRRCLYSIYTYVQGVDVHCGTSMIQRTCGIHAWRYCFNPEVLPFLLKTSTGWLKVRYGARVKHPGRCWEGGAVLLLQLELHAHCSTLHT